MKIVLFCGGRGSATIIRALQRRAEVELTLLVNGYDDGLSTGALRSFIPGMLGPSDFRKNLAWLLSGNAPYASLMEYRFPNSTGTQEIERLARFTRSGDAALLDAPLNEWFVELPEALAKQLRALLGRFFDHAVGTAFDYRDCSLGNLVFAGAYLLHSNDFNAAVAEVAALVGSRARLLNVADGQNRILVGLKQDGTVLASEAEIVGPQTPAPITDLCLLRAPLTAQDQQDLSTLDVSGKRAFLARRDALPALSPEAGAAIAQADLILYGPGTQHSSLLPSYRIATTALADAPAPNKVLVLNLDSDHDIQRLDGAAIVDQALAYGAPVTQILVDDHARLPMAGNSYRGAQIKRGAFAKTGLHDGDAVARHLIDMS
jgi:2-phospho-L-lactate transferase/gluconeogenesis factor (CofD/UPF0052 family)